MQSRKPRIGVFSRECYEFACFKLRVHDPLALLSDVVDTFFYRSIEEMRVDGEYLFSSDGEFIEAMDAFLVQRWFIGLEERPLIESILAQGKPIIFEMDDWLPALPSEYEYQNIHTLLEQYIWFLPKATLVVVSTPELAEQVKQYNSNVVVIPNAISQQRFIELPKRNSDQIVIGFAGTSSHQRDVDMITSALERIHSEYADLVRFVFWGNTPKKLVGLKGVVEHKISVPYKEYFHELAKLNLDIGLAPLEDTPFNRCKSMVKWMDYAMVGAVTVASHSAPYKDVCEQNLAVGALNNTEAWYAAIAGLIDDQARRQELAQKARKHLLNYGQLEQKLPLYIAAWNRILPQALHIKAPQRLGTLPKESHPSQSVQELTNYKKWKKKHQLREIHAEQYAERMLTIWDKRPSFILITLVKEHEKRRLVDSLNALENQLYPLWQLCVVADWEMPDPVFKEAQHLNWMQICDLDDASELTATLNNAMTQSGADWTLVLPAGFRLAPQALVRIGEAIFQHPDWVAIYADSDHVSPMGEYFLPAFRPDFAPDYLRAMDYIGASVAFSSTALKGLNGFEPYPGAYHYDVLLRLFEGYGQMAIGHIDDVLFSFPYLESSHLTWAAQKVALENHAHRLGLQVDVKEGYAKGTHYFAIQRQQTPLVSMIIPSRDKLELLQPCVESVLEKTLYPNFEILIVDNQSEEPETLAFYQSLQQHYPERVKVLSYNAPFNFSTQCNLGVSQAKGEFILLLNNDTEIIFDHWLDRLVADALQDGIGCVGARLLYPEICTVQHVGVILGLSANLEGVASHPFDGMPLSEPGYMNRIVTHQNYSAVTAACLLVRKSTYEAVGGLNESSLKILFNDVDFCLKVQQAGFRNLYNPYAVLYHHGSKSIKDTKNIDIVRMLQRQIMHQEEQRYMLEHWLPLIAHDPFYNRNLALIYSQTVVETTCMAAWDVALPGRKRVLGIPVLGGSGEYRVSLPLSVLQEQGKLDGEILQRWEKLPTLPELKRLEPDTLLVHSAISDEFHVASRLYKQYMPTLRLVTGMDDLLGQVPLKSNLHDHWKRLYPDAKQRLRKTLKYSDTLVVSTEPLVGFAEHMIDEIIVIPNRLRRMVWSGLRPRRRAGKKPRVGWVGANQHRGDLELLFEVIRQTADEVEWVFMGMCLPSFRSLISEFHRGVSFERYPATMASLNLDLAVAPLELNPFNEAKSNLRLLEYGALGWPVVCTDILPYQVNGAPVCRVQNKVANWVNAIRERIYDLDQAEQEGCQLQQWVQQHYWLEDHNEDWFAILSGEQKG